MSEAKTESESASAKNPDSPPPFKRRLLAYVAAWIVALISVDPDSSWFHHLESTIRILPMFPAGLFYMFGESAFILFPSACLIYIGHAVLLFLISNRRLYFAAYALLVLLLITNVHGCRQQLQKVSRAFGGR